MVLGAAPSMLEALGCEGTADGAWCVGVAIAAAVLVTTAPTIAFRRRRGRWVVVAGAVVVLWMAATGAGARLIVPGVVLSLLVLVAWRWRARAGRRRRAVEVAARVRECCESLSGELAAGLPPGPALEAPLAVWAPWRQVTAAHRVGGSVPDALRQLASAHPGAGDLRQVAAAWELTQHAGAALAESLAVVAGDIAEKQVTRALVRTELASARSTARLVVVLPVLTLAVGSGNGNPVGWLLGSPGGWLCLAAGGGLAVAGLGWIEAIATAVERESG